MRRKLIATAWLTAATVPLLAATLFLVGCCVLPFHQVLHEAVPLCHLAAQQAANETKDDDATPAREKQSPVTRIVSEAPTTFRLAAVVASQRLVSPTAAADYRNFITLGAARCDRDVGLHVLVDTFLI